MKKIPLTFGKYALVDDEDYEKVKPYKWYINFNGYVWRQEYIKGTSKNPKFKRISLHRFIMDINNSSIIIDHIDHNQLNNQKLNLRLCTTKQNTRYSKPHRRKLYKGIYFYKNLKKWSAKIQTDEGRLFLGLFDTIDDAALAYNDAAIKYFGEFAYLNKIPLESR